MPLAVAVTDAVRLLAITAETEFRRADAPEPGRQIARRPDHRLHVFTAATVTTSDLANGLLSVACCPEPLLAVSLKP